ncbi:MAG: serine/threonine protein kinase [Bradymonadales bacterium]|nr:serine/threonine protein kinase [Bradymonadales bacterium]
MSENPSDSHRPSSSGNGVIEPPEVADRGHSVFLSGRGGRSYLASMDTAVLPPIQPGSIIQEQYRIEEVLAEGSVCDIYLARCITGGEQVAIKVLAESKVEESEERERQVAFFLREAAVTAQLSHPNIIEILELGYEPGVGHFIVLEYLTGRTLEQVVEQEGVFDERRASKVAAQVLAALSIAHHQRVLHRDLKPSNIQLVNDPGEVDQVKVFDFGIALVFEELPWVKRLTQADTLVGTPAWMSPEQCRGQALDEQSDLYAVGALLYFMTTGRPPFEGESLYGVLNSVLSEDPRPVRDVRRELRLPPLSREFEKTMGRALQKDPAQRYVDAAHFLGYLDRYGAEEDWRSVSLVPGSAQEERSGMGLVVLRLEEERVGGDAGRLAREIGGLLPEMEGVTLITHGSSRATLLVPPLATPFMTLLEAAGQAVKLHREAVTRWGGEGVDLLVAMGDPTLGLFADMSQGAPLLEHLHQLLDRVVSLSAAAAEPGEGEGPPGVTGTARGGVFSVPENSSILRQEYRVQRIGEVHDPVRILSGRDRKGEGRRLPAQELVLNIAAGQTGGLLQSYLTEALGLVVEPLDLLDALSELKNADQIRLREDGTVGLSPSRKGMLPDIDLPPAEEAFLHLLLVSCLVRRGGDPVTSRVSLAEHLEAVHHPSAIRSWVTLAGQSAGGFRQNCLLRALRLAASSARNEQVAGIAVALSDLMFRAGLEQSAQRWAGYARLASRGRNTG